MGWAKGTERSSGFRPYIVFLPLIVIAAITGRWLIGESFQTPMCVLLYTSSGGFILNFAWKSHYDPDFCRSERHVEKKQLHQLKSKDEGAIPVTKPIPYTEVAPLVLPSTPDIIPSEKRILEITPVKTEDSTNA